MSYYKNNNNKKTYICSNCNNGVHNLDNCSEPRKSYGFILVNIDDTVNKINELLINTLCSNLKSQIETIDVYNNTNEKKSEISNVENKELDKINDLKLEKMKNALYISDNLRFLMLTRKNSLGYMEFIRGRYDLNDINDIINIFEQMMPFEIDKIKNIITENNSHNSYDKLRNELKLLNNFDNPKYFKEHKDAKNKFCDLFDRDNNNLFFVVNSVKLKYTTPEQGFPKGKKKYKENELDCAYRELEEETNISKSDISILNKIKPIVENIIGTDGRKYRHIYYLAIYKKNIKEIKINENNPMQYYEIGKMSWFTIEEALENIRPYHVEKKDILINIYNTFINVINNN